MNQEYNRGGYNQGGYQQGGYNQYGGQGKFTNSAINLYLFLFMHCNTVCSLFSSTF